MRQRRGLQCTAPPSCVSFSARLRPAPCPQVFQSTVRLLHMLAAAKAPKPSSGLELLLATQGRWAAQQTALQQLQGKPGPAAGGLTNAAGAQAGACGGGGGTQPAGPPGERAKAECQAAWEALQCECERLLGVVLDRQQAAAAAAGLKAAGQGEVSGRRGSWGRVLTMAAGAAVCVNPVHVCGGRDHC